MSRLTANPFHKPPPFHYPNAPLSPPETTVDAAGPSVRNGVDSLHLQLDTDLGQSASTMESAGARLRRVSSLAYHASSLGSPRDRAPHHRHHKSFVVVIPPSTFLEEHGPLGHTLSLGPRHRLSQGILMPLFPTMYAQLTAIAKEFNFPSTTGICLYLQYTDTNSTVTPRISDESWQLIWSHVFEAATPSSPGPPICGKIEFDIDQRHARWYASWIGAAQRSHLDGPFTAPSLAHFRQESRTTYAEDPVDDEQPDIRPHLPRSVSTPTRHVPRQLSLVDRVETSSVRSGRTVPRPSFTPPENISSAQTLSPIFQEEEPQTAKLDLESRVKSWRASASLNPTALAAKGQISLEPANMPNSISLESSTNPEADDELDPADYAWSISSAGPNDYELESVMSTERIMSIHIANRMEGSVCLTPSVCTSFGPSDYTLPSPFESEYRPFTPDIAGRMYEDVPPTPLTATSWGPASYYISSSESEYYSYSVDLGDRAIFSRPVTPGTATSWGPGSWPSSPIAISRPRSIHLGDRGDYSRPATPSTATSWGAPLSYPPSPVTPYFVSTPDAGHRNFDTDEIEPRAVPWAFGWPYFHSPAEEITPSAVPWAFGWPYFHSPTEEIAPSAVPWAFGWPYFHSPTEEITPSTVPWTFGWPYFNSSTSEKILSVTPIQGRGYPYLNIYEAVYPHFDLYPALPGTNSKAKMNDVQPIEKSGSTYPSYLKEFRTVYSYHSSTPVVSDRRTLRDTNALSKIPYLTNLLSVYAHFIEAVPSHSVMHAGYPSFVLYPAVSSKSKAIVVTPIAVRLPAQYPVLNIYPAVYPGNLDEIYPHTKLDIRGPIRVSIETSYPHLNIYPAVYPANLEKIYPQSKLDVKGPNRVVTWNGYPDFCLYPALIPQAKGYAPEVGARIQSRLAVPLMLPDRKTRQVTSQYPDFCLYPAVSTLPLRSQYPDFYLYPAVSSKSKAVVSPIAVRLPGQYPVLNIYPAVYPGNLDEIYPHIKLDVKGPIRIVASYPRFDLYPAISSDLRSSKAKAVVVTPLVVRLPARYPVLNIYPAVYPGNLDEIYPHLKLDVKGPIRVVVSYPRFDLYPAIFSDLGSSKAKAVVVTPIVVRLPARYPVLNICKFSYPAVYPGNLDEIYPHTKLDIRGPIRVVTSMEYPAFNLYPAVYPGNLDEIYPATRQGPNRVVTLAGYPDFCLYPALVPQSKGSAPKVGARTRSQATSQYPDFCLYPPVSLKKSGPTSQYPDFCLYPAVSRSPKKLTPMSLRLGSSYPTFNLYPASYPYFDLYPTAAFSHVKDQLVVVKSFAPYPRFILYPAVYPHFDLYPSWTQSLSRKSHKTHAQLWQLVMSERRLHPEGVRRPGKSHQQLHDSTFPNGQVFSPSGTPEPPARSQPQRISVARSRSGSIAAPLMPRPGQSLRLARAPAPVSPIIENEISPHRSPSSRMAKREESPRLSPVQDRRSLGLQNATLTRSVSAVTPQRPVNDSRLDRSQSASGGHRRRESLVLQRVKAFNTSADSPTPPPRIPLPGLPSGPKALDKSRFTFA